MASDRNGMRYSSSSSLSSVATVASTNSVHNNSSNNSNNLTQQQLQTINNLSPVILQQQQQQQPTMKSSPHHITQSLYLSASGTNTVSLPNSSNLSNISTANTTMMFPLSLTTTATKMTSSASFERSSPSSQEGGGGGGSVVPLKFTPNGLTSSASNQSISYFTTSASGTHPLTNGGLSAFSLRPTSETLISSNGQTMPLNLNASSASTMLSQSGFQMINSKDLNLVAAAAAGKNGLRTTGIAHDLHELAPNAAFMINKTGKDGKIELINSSTSDTNNVISSTAITSTTLPNLNASSSKLMDHMTEPPTKFIKLINGIALNAGLEAASHQKEVAPNGKGLHSGQLTLQQVNGRDSLCFWAKFAKLNLI
jgi:hypothetical protein